jgi:lysyl-tRNA synthetase class 2
MTDANREKLRFGRMDGSVFRMRHDLTRAIRSFFDSLGYWEVDAPMLTPYPTLDANILSVRADVVSETGKPHRLFLHTSPEYSMKKLLAAGAGKIYFLGKVFRDGECTPLHNPEFTLLEWYRTNATYADIMDETESMLHEVAVRLLKTDRIPFGSKIIDFTPPWPRVTVGQLFEEKTGLPLDPEMDLQALQCIAQRVGVPFGAEEDWETVFLCIFMEKMEPGLGDSKPVFLTDYPLRLGLNAKSKPDNPDWTERAELYIGGLEIANGYTELTDPEEQKKRFIFDQGRKKRETGLEYPVDSELIEAMKSGLPPCAGIALGLDRLLMLLADRRTIQDVLLFPFHQWE